MRAFTNSYISCIIYLALIARPSQKYLWIQMCEAILFYYFPLLSRGGKYSWKGNISHKNSIYSNEISRNSQSIHGQQKASNKSFRQTIEVSIQRVNRNSMLIKFPLYHKSNNLQRSEENSTWWIFNERAIIRW